MTDTREDDAPKKQRSIKVGKGAGYLVTDERVARAVKLCPSCRVVPHSLGPHAKSIAGLNETLRCSNCRFECTYEWFAANVSEEHSNQSTMFREGVSPLSRKQ